MSGLLRGVAVLTAVALLLIAACSGGSAPLDGTQWELHGWSVSSLKGDEFAITANFSSGQVSGHSGVNTYSGSYRTGPGSAFVVDDVAGTLMAGPEPAMRAESIFVDLLQQARSFELAEDRLTLYGEGGSQLLIFEAADD